MKPILVTSGEPAGIGPDICLSLASLTTPVVVMGDISVLQARAQALQSSVMLVPYDPTHPFTHKPGELPVWSLPIIAAVQPGCLEIKNASYVIQMLERAVQACQQGLFSGLVTGPVHKGIINDAGFSFTGHTEFLAEKCGVSQVVMMLLSGKMRVALATTHLPLRAVPDAITSALLERIIPIVYESLQQKFHMVLPRLLVAGLNPHAGEGGHLGSEEQQIISPVIEYFQHQGMQIFGPYAADTLFREPADAYLVMYHDQGLGVIKYASFGNAVNMTLGLPIVRTSVDHGTALSLAGTGQADSGSLWAAVEQAQQCLEFV
ncbi:MAG: 4-hydroxythreonine-4-phosphate dehydrogenase PdxA [Legionellaceae bacterium]|nr:4-hydroxythreonine-4-phosphate dehydrogenase PdxA [Legionellaceae bacterium]